MSQTAISGTVIADLRIIRCERAISINQREDGDPLVHSTVLKISEQTIREASDLIAKVDEIQFQICTQIASKKYSDSEMLMLAQERHRIVKEIAQYWTTHLAKVPDEGTFREKMDGLRNLIGTF